MDRRSSAPAASLSTNLKAVRFSGQSDGGDGIQSTKRTSFKDTTTIRWIKSLGEMSKEEKSLLWYTVSREKMVKERNSPHQPSQALSAKKH